MNKLEAPAGLGYSCAGHVIAVGADASEFQVGDRVACGGGGAVHAEVVAVPKNLCVPLPDGVDLREAAFTTIAAIAMQGVRQADLKLGETCVVIGLGLVGQLTLQLLHAAGVIPIGIDIDSHAVELAKSAGSSSSFARDQSGLEDLVFNLSSGMGADAVIIAASTSSLDPVNLAGILCRQKGRVVVVGGVPTGFDRQHYYRKELDLRMSCSYGPGRYDPTYEEGGIDYPPAYVRWTEKRNMQAFLQLLQEKKLSVGKLISHQFDLNEATEAYRMILEKKEPFCGIVLKYTEVEIKKERVVLRSVAPDPAQPRIGFIGAGSFAQNVLLPLVKKYPSAQLIGVATARPNNARHVADKYGFGYCTGNADEIINDPDINTVFIATRHDSHAEYVLKALGAGKHVFVEKPLCLKETELDEISSLYTSIMAKPAPPLLLVGFNRRFAPHVERIKKWFPPDLPKAINYRINAGAVPPTHWIHDPEIGGGRIIGEVCHFVDLALFLAGSPVMTVSAQPLRSPLHLNDSLVINLAFANGSVAAISYFSNGHPRLNKEFLEVFCAGQVAVVDDFRELRFFGSNLEKGRRDKQDKGHRAEVEAFLQAVRDGKPSPISYEELHMTTLVIFKIIEFLKDDSSMRLENKSIRIPE